jgi:hypothetical protein
MQRGYHSRGNRIVLLQMKQRRSRARAYARNKAFIDGAIIDLLLGDEHFFGLQRAPSTDNKIMK